MNINDLRDNIETTNSPLTKEDTLTTRTQMLLLKNTQIIKRTLGKPRHEYDGRKHV
jgi:hypothetical protein